jgi:hypothetical protein
MKKISSKNGVASMFIVVFTTMLLTIISLGFVSIMISEANQTINYDLSQSAYDSALAGIEDAKIALLKYHQCLSGVNASTPECQKAVSAMTTNYDPENCDIISDMLARPHVPDTETIIQSESGTNIVKGGTEIMEQAYTCVRISENTPDYLGTLNQNYRTKVIPIRTADVGKVDRIRLGWYNSEDSNKVASSGSSLYAPLGLGTLTTNKKGYDLSSASEYQSSNNFTSYYPSAPPTVQFQLIQTAANFSLAQLSTNSGATSNRGALLLRPGGSGVNLVKNGVDVGLASSADKSFNNPIDIKCNMGAESYRCSADIVIPSPISGTRNSGTAFVRVVLPYNTPDTSFSLTLFSCGANNNNIANADKDCERMQFAGVQTKIDSTGRANDLFRRVEARIEMVDIYYPFPEFAADVSGNDSDSIWKNFWVTQNCWITNTGNTGQSCPNVGSLGGR